MNSAMKGYMQKTALVPNPAQGAVFARELMPYAVAFALLAPPVAGIGLGKLHSSLTSPTEEDAETLQNKAILKEMNEATADILRKRELDLKKDARKERTLRI